MVCFMIIGKDTEKTLHTYTHNINERHTHMAVYYDHILIWHTCSEATYNIIYYILLSFLATVTCLSTNIWQCTHAHIQFIRHNNIMQSSLDKWNRRENKNKFDLCSFELPIYIYTYFKHDSKEKKIRVIEAFKLGTEVFELPRLDCKLCLWYIYVCTL